MLYPVFTMKEIMKYTQPQLGYNKKSLGLLRFMNVLVGMIGAERKSLLPPYRIFLPSTSGLANLHPK